MLLSMKQYIGKQAVGQYHNFNATPCANPLAILEQLFKLEEFEDGFPKRDIRVTLFNLDEAHIWYEEIQERMLDGLRTKCRVLIMHFDTEEHEDFGPEYAMVLEFVEKHPDKCSDQTYEFMQTLNRIYSLPDAADRDE